MCLDMLKCRNALHCDIWILCIESRGIDNHITVLVFPPALKKGMVRLLKKGTLSARQHVKRALSARNDKQKGTFLSDLWHAGKAHLSTVIRFNTVVILLCNLLFSFCSFLNFHISEFSFTTEKLENFFSLTLL